jgi:cytochrome b
MKAAVSRAGVNVWDAPVRAFHWSLALCFGVAWMSRGARLLDVHAAAGYAMAALLVFRIFWGFAGSEPARFRAFLVSPVSALGYLRQAITGGAPTYTSHNPAGGWSVVMMMALGLLLTIAGSALFSAQHGYGLFGTLFASADAGKLHVLHEYAAWAMLALVGLHLAGVLFGTAAHDEDLIGAMLTGRKRQVPPDQRPVERRPALALALAATVAVGAATYLRQTGWTDDYAALRSQAASSANASMAAAWRGECGSCHLAYPPELLPRRSWLRMLETQQSHFGEDLGLSTKTRDALSAIVRAEGARPHWAGSMIQASVVEGDAPQRISETRFWRERHGHLDPRRFSVAPVSGRHDCEACHADAASAIFSPRMIHLPECSSAC